MSHSNLLDMNITSKLYDLSMVKDCGQLIIPLSMAKLNGLQKPSEIYQFLKDFGTKIRDAKVDVYIIYTNGLYFNSKETSLDLRKKSSYKISNHAQELKNIISKKVEFMPSAIHFVAWDTLILNAPGYNDSITLAQKEYNTKGLLFDAVNQDILKMDREINEENIAFILEELVINHMIRNKFIPLPTCLSNDSDAWRLLTYPGVPLLSDIIFCKNKMLKRNRNKRFINKYEFSFYDWLNKSFYDYTRVEFQEAI